MPAVRFRLVLARLALVTIAPLLGAQAAAAAPDDAVDITSVRDKLSLVSDGKGHYVAYAPLPLMSDFLFYGDGKHFYRLRVSSGGSEGDIRFSRTFWDPRGQAFSGGYFQYQDKKYTVECASRTTELTKVPDAEAASLVAGAQWHKPLWKYRAHLLARDDRARYYFVDRVREPEDSKSFRLFMGPKGNLKLQKMTNVVSDSQGDIFSTKTGSLRLIADKADTTWVEGGKKIKLTPVPVDQNAKMIYTELGVYAGERLGTPCDDL